MMRRVAVIGSLSLDTNRGLRREVRQIGGVVTYAGLTLRRHGVRTCAITRVREDEQWVLDPLKEEGVELIVEPSAESTAFVNELAGDVRIQWMVGKAEPIGAELIGRVPRDVDCFILGALHPEDVSLEALDAIEAREQLVACDIQGYVRVIEDKAVRAAAHATLPMILRLSRVVKAASDELRVVEIALGEGVEGLLERFEIDELVETQGSRGGRVFVRGRGAYSYQAVPVPVPVDSTGAGDVFFAAYLVARLRDATGQEGAAIHAAAIAAEQVAGIYIEKDAIVLD